MGLAGSTVLLLADVQISDNECVDCRDNYIVDGNENTSFRLLKEEIWGAMSFESLTSLQMLRLLHALNMLLISAPPAL